LILDWKWIEEGIDAFSSPSTEEIHDTSLRNKASQKGNVRKPFNQGTLAEGEA
jgi:hypothetical protein